MMPTCEGQPGILPVITIRLLMSVLNFWPEGRINITITKWYSLYVIWLKKTLKLNKKTGPGRDYC